MGAFTIPSIFTAVDKFSAPVRKMTANMQSFSQKAGAGINRLDRNVRKLTPSLGGLGKQMLAFASAGVLIAGVGNAVNTIKEYEQANADLSAVMNTSIENQNTLGKDAERLGSITAKSATEVVGLQEAFARLGFTTPEIVNMTEATIAGSIAMNAELSNTAELTGAMVKTFDSFSSIDAPDILDKMTLATQKSALNFEKLETALPIVGGAANAAGIGFEQMLSLLGKLSDAGIDASSSSTALRNIFLDSAKKGHSYTQILQNIQANQDKLTAANDEFGKRGAVSATILANKLEEVDVLTNKLSDSQTFQGAAQKAAEKRLDTFEGSLTLLSSAYEGLLLDINKGSGALGIFKKVIQFVTKHIKAIAVTIGVLVGAFVALKIAIGLTKGFLIAYNVVMGISAVLNGGMTKAVASNTVALGAYKVMTTLVTAAQWLWNVALSANPIGLIIIGIAAMIALITIIIVKYDEWGAAMTTTLGPLGMIINMIMSFRRNWDYIVSAFNNGGILGGIKAIGIVILDSILMPLQQMLELIDRIPGVELGLDDKLAAFRANLGVENQPLNPEAAKQEGLANTIEKTQTSNMNININDPSGAASIESDVAPIGVNISSTGEF